MSRFSFVAAVQTDTLCLVGIASKSDLQWIRLEPSEPFHYTTCMPQPNTPSQISSRPEAHIVVVQNRQHGMSDLACICKLTMAYYTPYVCVDTDALCEHKHPSRTGQLDVL